MHSVKYAIIQYAKGPFASDSISMNVVLSSNTAYRDQFSGRTRFSSLPEKRGEKKEKQAISYSRVIRASHAASNPLVSTWRICRLWKCFSPVPAIFPAISRRTSSITHLLLDVYPAPTISSRCSSRNYPLRGSFHPLRDPRLVDRTDRIGSTLLDRCNGRDDVRRRREPQWYRCCCGQPRSASE